MTEHELAAALKRNPNLAEVAGMTKEQRAKFAKHAEDVTSLAGHPGWKLLNEQFTAERARLLITLIKSPTEALASRIRTLDEVLRWPLDFVTSADEILQPDPLR